MLVAKAAFENLKVDMEASAGEFEAKEDSGLFLRSSRACAQAITILKIAERKVTDKYDFLGDDE